MTVGVLDGKHRIAGCLNSPYSISGFDSVTGEFVAETESGLIVLTDRENREIIRSPEIRFVAGEGATFKLAGVIIGIGFHWEREEEQTFRGNLILRPREDGLIIAINEIHLEDYLESVISSEMSPAAPPEFLKTHAILSRSWLLCALERKAKAKESRQTVVTRREQIIGEEIVRWYEQEDHDYFDVCADDHCQRYQGITKIISENAVKAVRDTRGCVIIDDDQICDARFSKACGGLTEEFRTCWEDREISYLTSVPDALVPYKPLDTEDEASRWILSEPDAYCGTRDENILRTILPDFDRETGEFFRWTVEYSREELEDILRKKTGINFGILEEIRPLSRGPSGRIYRLRITGSEKSMIVGKELEIRRWLSRSHLYSSAFVVETQRDAEGNVERFVFRGAGWGHGVGLCQIGAAVMATRGFNAEQILKHYFPGVEIKSVYT